VQNGSFDNVQQMRRLLRIAANLDEDERSC
jgi:hypothetical protein